MQYQTKVILAMAPVMVILSVMLVMSVYSSPPPVSTDSEGGVKYKGYVCVSVTRANGDYEDLGCSSNDLFDVGASAVRDMLGRGGTYAAFDFIGLCNATITATSEADCPNAADMVTTHNNLTNETTDGGLARAQGTYSNLEQAGNWSIQHTFTAGEDISTNLTGLFNGSSVAQSTILAANNFALVTLSNLDQLTVNWTITVSNG